MISFATGILAAVVLAAGTYFAMQAGTVTMVERSASSSTVIEGIWEEGWFREPHRPLTAPDGS